MVECSPGQLDGAFMALADATRRSILGRLTTGEATVTELAEPYPMSLNAVSKHLKVLESARLLNRRIEGRIHYCSLSPEGLFVAAEWLERYRVFWEQRLNALEEFLLANKRQEGGRHGRNRDKTRTSASGSKNHSRNRRRGV